MNRHVIIIHEIYGVTPNLLALKEELESSGFSVSLPSLYEDGYTSQDEKEAYERFSSQVGIDKALSLIDKIIRKHGDSEITLIGFSVGATIAWLSSRSTKVGRVIGIYGSAIRKYKDIQPEADTQLFFTKERSFDAEELNRRLNKKENVSSAMIPGEHGFYSREDYGSPLVQSLNGEILKILEAP